MNFLTYGVGNETYDFTSSYQFVDAKTIQILDHD